MTNLNDMLAENNHLQAQLDQERANIAALKAENATLQQQVTALRAFNPAEISARAASAERARCKAILTGPEAEGRAAQARVFAFESDVPETLAAQLLAAQPREAGANRIPSIAERAAEAEAEMRIGARGFGSGGAGFGGDSLDEIRGSRDPLAAAVKAQNNAAQRR